MKSHLALYKIITLLICCGLLCGLFPPSSSLAEETELQPPVITSEQEARMNEFLAFWLHSMVSEDTQLSFNPLINQDENGNEYYRENTFIVYLSCETAGRLAIIIGMQEHAAFIDVDHLVDESERFPKVEMTAENIAEQFDTIYKSHVHPAFFDEAAAKQRVIEYDSWYLDENDETVFQQFITLKSDETYGQITYPAGTIIVFQLYSNRLSNTLPQISILWPDATD